MSHVWISFLAVLLSFFQGAAVAEQRVALPGQLYADNSSGVQGAAPLIQAMNFSKLKIAPAAMAAMNELPALEWIGMESKRNRISAALMAEKIASAGQLGTLSTETSRSQKKGLQTRRIC